jgi:activator-of-BECN1-regulated-autophagy protein 1
MSFEASSMGQVLAARSIAAADCLTCVQVSPTGQHVLLAYGRRSRRLSCLVDAQGSYEVWHTVLQVRRGDG